MARENPSNSDFPEDLFEGDPGPAEVDDEALLDALAGEDIDRILTEQEDQLSGEDPSVDEMTPPRSVDDPAEPPHPQIDLSEDFDEDDLPEEQGDALDELLAESKPEARDEDELDLDVDLPDDPAARAAALHADAAGFDPTEAMISDDQMEQILEEDDESDSDADDAPAEAAEPVAEGEQTPAEMIEPASAEESLPEPADPPDAAGGELTDEMLEDLLGQVDQLDEVAEDQPEVPAVDQSDQPQPIEAGESTEADDQASETAAPSEEPADDMLEELLGQAGQAATGEDDDAPGSDDREQPSAEADEASNDPEQQLEEQLARQQDENPDDAAAEPSVSPEVSLSGDELDSLLGRATSAAEAGVDDSESDEVPAEDAVAESAEATPPTEVGASDSELESTDDDVPVMSLEDLDSLLASSPEPEVAAAAEVSAEAAGDAEPSDAAVASAEIRAVAQAAKLRAEREQAEADAEQAGGGGAFAGMPLGMRGVYAALDAFDRPFARCPMLVKHILGYVGAALVFAAFLLMMAGFWMNGQ